MVLLTFFDDKCSTDDEGSHTEYQINMYPEGGCLNDPDSTESTLYERVGPNTVRKTFFHQHDCKEETFNFKIDFDFGTCVESFGQGAGFAQMALDPETAAFDLLNVFPGSVASDFPLVSSQPSQPVQRTWTSYQWYMDASCSQPAPASPIFLKENELCYDAESSGPSSSNYGSGRFTTLEQYGGMEVWQMFTGQACKPENLYNTVSIGDGACVKVPEPTSPTTSSSKTPPSRTRALQPQRTSWFLTVASLTTARSASWPGTISNAARGTGTLCGFRCCPMGSAT